MTEMSGTEARLQAIEAALLQLVAAYAQNQPEAKQKSRDSHIHALLADSNCPAYCWSHLDATAPLRPIFALDGVDLNLLQAMDGQKQQIILNSSQFAAGYPANNALLWGARGTGKSSLVKAVFKSLWESHKGKIGLVEIARNDLESLPLLLELLASHAEKQFFLFCDDLSFEMGDAAYKSLKAVLEGGVAGCPSNVIFYATSNRRHLMPRDMAENETGGAIHPSEAVEEKISLSDRFGLWIGFYDYNQAEYLAMVKAYIDAYKIPVQQMDWQHDALEWSITRGARSGRVAAQFILALAGRLHHPITLHS